MDISPNKLWLPKEWESHANKLLAERYTHANYIPIPDQDRGDGGIEGFSLDGHAYQMYCPEGAQTVSKLYEKQRTKMTDDVNKFIENKDNKLTKIFGSTKIKRWILVVPSNQTKELVMHATKKTKEILSANLDYVDNTDFRVLIWDRTTFEKEERSLLLSGINVLKLSPLKVDLEEIHSFVEDGEPEHYSNIKKKLLKLKKLNEEKVERGRQSLIKHAIISQNMLSYLKENHAEYYEQINACIIAREDELSLDAFEIDESKRSLECQTKTLQNALSDSCKLHNDNLKQISQGTISEWLMRCPLDFE